MRCDRGTGEAFVRAGRDRAGRQLHRCRGCGRRLPEREEMIEVKTGLLGLGKHYWVPFSAVEEVTQACVFLKRPKDELDSAGWDERPSYLDQLA